MKKEHIDICVQTVDKALSPPTWREPSMQHVPQMAHPQEVVKLYIAPDPLERNAPINTNWSNNDHAIEIAYGLRRE